MNQDAPPLPTLQQQAMQFLNRITDLPRVRHLLAKLIPVSLCLPDLDAQSFGHRFGGVTFGQSIEIGLAPVSYTHLDVYKRQVQTVPKRLPNSWLRVFQSVCL